MCKKVQCTMSVLYLYGVQVVSLLYLYSVQVYSILCTACEKDDGGGGDNSWSYKTSTLLHHCPIAFRINCQK